MLLVGHLKVVAEAWYVISTRITMDNFIENFYLADTKKCALLKEKVCDFLFDNATDALKKLSDQEEGGLQSQNMIADVLTAVARGKRKREDYEGHDPSLINTMSVDTMRKRLDQRGFSVDGTREMLIDTLQKTFNNNEVAVKGAGTIEINGTYQRDGDYKGAPKYKRACLFEEQDAEFILYRDSYNSDQSPLSWCWFISLWTNGDDENCFESFYKKPSDEITPATGKWEFARFGEVPYPTISFKDAP